MPPSSKVSKASCSCWSLLDRLLTSLSYPFPRDVVRSTGPLATLGHPPWRLWQTVESSSCSWLHRGIHKGSLQSCSVKHCPAALPIPRREILLGWGWLGTIFLILSKEAKWGSPHLSNSCNHILFIYFDIITSSYWY